MTKEISVIRSITGPCRTEVETMACAVEVAETLLFSQRISMDDIRVNRDIYSAVAKQEKKKLKTVARQIERTGNLYWESLDEKEMEKYIGKILKDIRGPRDMIFYLAFYAYFGKPYYKVLEENPSFPL